MSSIEIVITPKESDLGDNFIVRRSLPFRKKRSVGPFVFWDHMGPVKISNENPMKVRSHPHIGLATITWLFSGEILHRDSLQNEQFIRPGEVNWMTAGAGIAHSERSEVRTHDFILEGIQIWLALPKEFEDVAPSFFHCKENDIPKFYQNKIQLNLIAGSAFNKRSPVPAYSDLFYLNAKGDQEQEFKMNIKDNHEAALYIIDGEIKVEDKTYKRFDLIVFKKGHSLNFEITKKARFIIFGGEVLPEKRHMWWNFVSSSKEKIELAKRKWEDNLFGQVINETEKIDLPK